MPAPRVVHRYARQQGQGDDGLETYRYHVLGNVAQEASVHESRIAVFRWQATGTAPAWTPGWRSTHTKTCTHAGELETSILLATHPDVIRPGNETADWTADDRPHLLTLGMGGYTKSGVVGRPSLGTSAKGRMALASLARSFEPLYGLLARAPPDVGLSRRSSPRVEHGF